MELNELAEDKKTKRLKEKPLKILIAASEAVPFAKTGGLADVAGALPIALKKLGHDVRIVIPRYSCIDIEKFGIKNSEKQIRVNIALFDHFGVIMESVLPGTDIPAYFIENTEFFHREGLYGTEQDEYWDNAERFIFFSRAVVEMLRVIDFRPDVIHCSDWHTGLIPVYLRTTYAWDKNAYGTMATVYSIHNMAYQGVFDRGKLSHAGLPDSLFNVNEMEFYGGVSFMKGGIVFSDIINTVSQRYKEETKTPEFGCGLDGLLASRGDDYYGVLNGIDYSIWNPATDALLPANYTPDDLTGKTEVKKAMLEEFGLKYIENVPVIGLVSRLDGQKGLDFIASIIEDMMRMNLQFVVLGTGEERYHEMLSHFKGRYPEKLGLMLKFDNRLAHMIYAGCDMFVMPSHFEPCGLGQLISLKYGTVPLVRETGGLADTVRQYNFKTKQGNGFVFGGFNPYDLLHAIVIAADTYKNKTVWNRIMMNGMKMDFSWQQAAAEYTAIYRRAVDKAYERQNLI